MALELISFGTGTKWISKLWGKLWSGRKKYKEELDKINLVIFNDPLEIAKYYVEPDCQDRNPADHYEKGVPEKFRLGDIRAEHSQVGHGNEEEDNLLPNNPIMTIIDEFFQSEEVCQQGGNQMFILSDAGMGKTSLLAMLKLMHLAKFWPEKTNCVLAKLGKTTVDDLSEINNKGETILLLDSLDEDPGAYARVKERLLEILRASRDFFKVIITCRTQFFPGIKKDHSEQPGMVSVGGFKCPARYLSIFTDEKVTFYLEKRFPDKLFTSNKKIENAREVTEKMGHLRYRPIFLSYIEYFMALPVSEKNNTEYEIYDALVQTWLRNEKSKYPGISEQNLLEACIILAAVMNTRKERSINEQNLDALISEIVNVKPIKEIELRGNALINRNSNGAYRFSHYTIQEFLVTKLLLEKPLFKPEDRIIMTDFILRMISLSGKVPEFIDLLDFKGTDLCKIELENIKLPGSDLQGIDFSYSNLSGADFSGADLTNANFSNACLKGADLTEAKLGNTNLGMAILGPDISNINFESARVEGIRFVNITGMGFVYIPPGEFVMGSPEDETGKLSGETMHKVTLTKGFFMQSTQVTQGQWQAIMGNNPSSLKNCNDCPVENVTWNNVQEFIKKLNENEKNGAYRLPTEAEWEYACRAGSETAYCFGNDDTRLSEYAWFQENSDEKTHPVGQLKPNDRGLHDMHGNVWEWCQDSCGWEGSKGVITDTYRDGVTDPVNTTGSGRIVRGGAWFGVAQYCRSAQRFDFHPDSRVGYVGFRLALFSPVLTS